jgi:hypothetical protein
MACLREWGKTPVVKLEMIGAKQLTIRLTRNVGIGSRSQEESVKEDKIERMSVTVTGTNEESTEVAER